MTSRKLAHLNMATIILKQYAAGVPLDKIADNVRRSKQLVKQIIKNNLQGHPAWGLQ